VELQRVASESRNFPFRENYVGNTIEVTRPSERSSVLKLIITLPTQSSKRYTCHLIRIGENYLNIDDRYTLIGKLHSNAFLYTVKRES